MIKNFSLDSAMYYVTILLAFGIVFSTAAASIAVGLGTAFIIFSSVRKKTLPKFDPEIIKVLGIYFLCQIFIAATSLNPATSFREVGGEFHRFFPLLFAMTFIKKREQLQNILIAVLIAGIINSAAGIFQFCFTDEPRAFGFSHTPTFFGSFMLMLLPLQIFISRLEFMPDRWRIIAACSTILTLLGLLFSMTRGAWLTLVCITAIFFAMEKKYRAATFKFSLTAGIAAIIIFTMSQTFNERMETITNPKFQSNSERVLMWQSALNIWKDYPIHGCGQKMFFKLYNEEYISPDAKERPGEIGEGHTHPHNNFMKVASEGGIIGLLAFVGLYAYFFRRFYLQFRQEKFMNISAGLTAFIILAALQLEGLTDTNMNQVPLMREFWLIAGMMLAIEQMRKNFGS